jgi:tRNA pseudouridine13 synthase
MFPTVLELALNPPLWTADLPGISGRIRAEPEDFVVEEIPAYDRSGVGEFLFLWIEKRGMGAEHFVREVARRLGIRPGDVGTAGIKDRHAVTRQWISVPAVVQGRLSSLDGDGIQLHGVERHSNKLKPGHLRGNRFNILVRDPLPNASEQVPQLVERIRQCGIANFYGSQRFGRDGETARLGWAILRGEPPPLQPGGTKSRVSPFLRKLALSAVQSALFNRYLAKRVSDGLMQTVLEGDVMAKWPVGGMFVAEDVAAEQARFDRHEIVSAGPIFGKKTFAARGISAEREAEVLSEVGIDSGAFRSFGKLLQGTRRHNIVYVDDLTATVESSGVRLDFSMPAGSYATVLLREIMKCELKRDDES